jgi:TonB family protein
MAGGTDDPTFAEVRRRGAPRRRMVPFVAASLAVQVALLAAVTLLWKRPGVERLVEVKILPLRPPALAPERRGGAPPPPPAPAIRAPRRNGEKTPIQPLVQPKVVREEQPPPRVEPPATASSAAEPDARDPGAAASGGAEGGGVGGVPGGVVRGDGRGGASGLGLPDSRPLPPASPIAARPKDLQAVRDRIARTLRYPPRAKDLRWEGRCLVEFVLLAGGAIRDLRLVESSGRPLLDEAALAAVQSAVPFPPPGVDVLVRTPIAFRLQTRL